MNSTENVKNSKTEVKRLRPLSKVLYGLPCAQCRIYYPTNLPSCPVCQRQERVPALRASPGLAAPGL